MDRIGERIAKEQIEKLKRKKEGRKIFETY